MLDSTVGGQDFRERARKVMDDKDREIKGLLDKVPIITIMRCRCNWHRCMMLLLVSILCWAGERSARAIGERQADGEKDL